VLVDEPYDRIDGRVIVAVAERNVGPVQSMLDWLISRRSLEAIRIASRHDIHIGQPLAIAT